MVVAVEAHLVDRLHESLVVHGHLLLVFAEPDGRALARAKALVEVLRGNGEHVVPRRRELRAVSPVLGLVGGAAEEPEAVDFEGVEEDAVRGEVGEAPAVDQLHSLRIGVDADVV